MSATPLTEVRLSAEFHCDPVWVPDDEGVPLPVPATELPVSPGLAAAITAWGDEWQSIYIDDDPASSRFATDAEEDAFHARGRVLAERLRAELDATVTVSYFDKTGPGHVTLPLEGDRR